MGICKFLLCNIWAMAVILFFCNLNVNLISVTSCVPWCRLAPSLHASSFDSLRKQIGSAFSSFPSATLKKGVFQFLWS